METKASPSKNLLIHMNIVKTISQLLIRESWLEEDLESRTGRKSAIPIIMESSMGVFSLCDKGQRFGEVLKVLQKYWEARPGLVCIKYTGIGLITWENVE